MSKNYDNWEKLVETVLRREHDRELAMCVSRTPSNLSSASSSDTDHSFRTASPFDYQPHDLLVQARKKKWWHAIPFARGNSTSRKTNSSIDLGLVQKMTMDDRPDIIYFEQGSSSVDLAPEQKMTTNGRRNTIYFEEGWDFVQKGITKLLEGLPKPYFSSEDYMMLYTTIYNMCAQAPPHDYSQKLYDKYRESIEEYITSTVLPSLREKHDEFLLRELVQRWTNHKIMVRWLSRFFNCLDRRFIVKRSLPTLKEVGLTCFQDLVYKELNGKVRDVVISI